MDIESLNADEMPDDAWEQRVQFQRAISEMFELLLMHEKYKDITINSVSLALLGFFYRHTENIEDFDLLSKQFVAAFLKSCESWCEKYERRKN